MHLKAGPSQGLKIREGVGDKAPSCDGPERSMSFSWLQFFRKTIKNNLTRGTIVVGLNGYVRFLKELKIPKTFLN